MNPYYQDNAVTIYHGDCREILLQLEPVDLVLTDPQWGVRLTEKAHKDKSYFYGDVGYGSSDDSQEYVKTVCVPAIALAIELFGRVVVLPGTRCAFFYPRPDEIGSVYQPAGTGSGKWGFICSTPILFYGSDPYLTRGLGRRPNSWHQPATDHAEINGHPCPKPMRMMVWLVERASFSNETILDPFMGSGATLRAAKDLGRKAIGIEIEEKYCEIAARRMAQEVLELTA